MVCLTLAHERVVGVNPVLLKGPGSSAMSLLVPHPPSRASTQHWA